CFSDATLETFRNIASNGPRIPARYTMSPIINTMPHCTPSIIQASDHNGLSACVVWGQFVGHTAVISTCTTEAVKAPIPVADSADNPVRTSPLRVKTQHSPMTRSAARVVE